jgi:hypothetical protein
MKKFLMALICVLPMSVLGADFGTIGVSATATNNNGVTLGFGDDGNVDVSLAGAGYTFGYDQDGNELSLGTHGISLSHSDTTKVGLGYSAGIGFFDGGISYDWGVDGDHSIGASTAVSVAGVSLDTSLDWNLSDRDLTGELGTSYEIAGINTSATSNWDIDDFSYEGIDFDAGYTWQVASGLSLTPSVGMGFDSDWSRGDATASVAINLSFGGTSATE